MSAHWMPFTVHFKVKPDRTGKRFEHVRDLQKLGYFIYQALKIEPTLNLALPGGGQAANLGQYSDLVYGTAVKPQFGETPAQAQVTGFWWIPSIVPITAQPQRQLIHAGQWVVGPYNQTPADTDPNPTIQGQVKSLVDLLEGLANAGLPGHYDPVEVFRLDFANITWGDRGRSFPR